jgi:hypothetical protein
MVILFPGPLRRMFEHDFLETEQTPKARSMSRYRGILKLEAARFDRLQRLAHIAMRIQISFSDLLKVRR